MAATARWMPLTHGIEAARALADGAALGSVGDLVLRELGVGALYVVVGLGLIRGFEYWSRRGASLAVM
jgi:ABC-2 type transport system permease protein